MNVKVVSITQSLVEEKPMTAEELLVYIARVSNPSNQLNTETSPKLLRYCIAHKHWSPFDMINLCVQVVTSRAIAAQILRHWSIKPQEFSQRYAEAVEVEPIELRQAAAKNRQSSEEVFNPTIFVGMPDNPSVGVQVEANDLVALHVEGSLDLYRKLLDAGVAKECARMVLPLATSTTLYLNGSVRSWIHYLEQRCDQHAQKEHRLVANQIKDIFTKHFPHTAEAIYGNQ